MKVSKQTQGLVECLKLLQTINTKVNKAIEGMVDDVAIGDILADMFLKDYDALEKHIEDLLLMSIRDKISTNSQEI